MPADSAIAQKIMDHPEWKKKYFVADAIPRQSLLVEVSIQQSYNATQVVRAPGPSAECFLLPGYTHQTDYQD